MANLSDIDPPDKRIDHMKLLCLKQLQVISDAGGIGLRIFHIRVTHVNVLQVSERSRHCTIT